MAADDLERYGYTQELSRSLRFTDLLVYGLVFMVPIAPFGIFGGVFQASGGMVALAYAIGMLAMMFTAASYAQMARTFPMAGSVYSYAGRGLGAPVGFVAGWMILLDYVLVPGLLYLVSGVAMHSLVPAVPVWIWLVGFVVLNTAVNYLGIEMTARVNKVMLLAELVVLAIFLVVGIGALVQGKANGPALSPLVNPDTFSWGVVFGAVSIAALLLAGTLFVVQTWVAALLVPDPAQLIEAGDPGGTAFYDAAGVAGGPWLKGLTAVSTAIAWGFANSLVAQAATSRLLYAMARDRQLPGFLARVHPKRKVPVNATLLVAAVSLALGIVMSLRDDGHTLLSSLVNFGALTAFLLLHVTVVGYHVVRRRSRRWWAHLVVPVVGFGILAFVVVNARVAAQTLGFVWLGVGVVILLVLVALGRKPNLAEVSDAKESTSD